MGRRPFLSAAAACLAAAVSCTPASPPAARAYALRGTIVSPSDVLQDGSVVVDGPAIAQVSATAAPAAVDVDGAIFPGLVDLHNHITWNLFPRWKPGRVFGDRYEWQKIPDYAAKLSNPHAALDDGLGRWFMSYSCDMDRYGELKEIVNGATSTVGGTPADCVRGLARNLDYLGELAPNQKAGTEALRNLVFPLRPSTPCAEQAIRDIGRPVGDCQGAKVAQVRAAVAHVAEGANAAARAEFAEIERRGYLVHGFNIIHGVALEREDFHKMAQAGAGFIWSPRSNFELYGKTADIASVRAEKLTMAIAPDWSPSGSSGMLAELAYADRLRQRAPFDALSDQDLVEMATINPATLAGLESRLGRLAPGYASDLIVMRKRQWTGNEPPTEAQAKALAYQALLKQTPADLKLVVIGGVPVFGEPALMAKLLSADELRQTEAIPVCGQSRVINVKAGTYASKPWSATERRLRDALASLKIEFADFVECQQGD